MLMDTHLPFLCEAFDAPAYGHHCLAKYLERQREETMGPQKLVFEYPSRVYHSWQDKDNA